MPQRTRTRPEQENAPQAMAPSSGGTDWTAANQAASAGDQAIDHLLGWDANEYQQSTQQEGGE